MAEAVVRDGRAEDLPAINDIYNHYVLETAITFEVEPVTMAARREWFTHYAPTGRHRLFVAAAGDDVLGYATSSPYHDRAAYETSVEVSVYLDPGSVGRASAPGCTRRCWRPSRARTSIAPTAASRCRTRRRSTSTSGSASAASPTSPSRAASSAATGTSPSTRGRCRRRRGYPSGSAAVAVAPSRRA